MPLWAASTRPTPSACAPVKAPRRWPKSCDRARSARSAPQFTGRKGLPARALFSWMARATSSLPVPVSPRTTTGEVGAGGALDQVEHAGQPAGDARPGPRPRRRRRDDRRGRRTLGGALRLGSADDARRPRPRPRPAPLGPDLGEAGRRPVGVLARLGRVGGVPGEQEERAAALVALAHLAQQVGRGAPLAQRPVDVRRRRTGRAPRPGAGRRPRSGRRAARRRGGSARRRPAAASRSPSATCASAIRRRTSLTRSPAGAMRSASASAWR